jgi:putative transposase
VLATTAGGCRTRRGRGWGRRCPSGRGVPWAATTRARRTAPRRARSSSSRAPAAGGTRSAPPGSAPRPPRTGASPGGPRPACSRRPGGGASWPATGRRGSAGHGRRWVGRRARPRSAGGTGPNPAGRGELGGERSPPTDRRGTPPAVVIAGADDHKPARATPEAIPVGCPAPAAETPRHLRLVEGHDHREPRALADESASTPRPRTRGEERAARRHAGAKARRWAVERARSWLNRFRRVPIRREEEPAHHVSMVRLALAIIARRACRLPG